MWKYFLELWNNLVREIPWRKYFQQWYNLFFISWNLEIMGSLGLCASFLFKWKQVYIFRTGEADYGARKGRVAFSKSLCLATALQGTRCILWLLGDSGTHWPLPHYSYCGREIDLVYEMDFTEQQKESDSRSKLFTHKLGIQIYRKWRLY